MLQHGDLRLVLSAPGGGPGGGQAMPDGTKPEPGGWNRFSLEVDDLDDVVATLGAKGAHFRNEIVEGVGGRQILVDDPSGNPDGECVGVTACNGAGACVSLAQGAACTLDAECASGFCTDGFCCNAGCTFSCTACAMSKTGQADGTCANVTSGTDPS